jgi:cytidine deaminase
LTSDGAVFGGCNVENASYGLCICAERTAIVKAVSEGETSFPLIAVHAPDGSGEAAPCGACRQFLVEFNPDMIVIDVPASKSDEYRVWTAKELLPAFFGPSNLK